MVRSLIISLLVIVPTVSSAQVLSREAVTSGGGIAAVNNAITWSIGEAVISHYQTTSFSISQGFQQNEITGLIGIPATSAIHVGVAPNPFTDQIQIRHSADKELNAEYIICNIAGEVILSGAITDNTSIINTRTLAAGVYMLLIRQKDIEQKVKILKL